MRGYVVIARQLRIARAGERTDRAGKAVANKILRSLCNAEYRRISPYPEFIDLPDHFGLHEPQEKRRFPYFLNRGLASIVVTTRGGRNVEAGVVGYEGAVGTAVAVGPGRSPLCEVMQIQGDGFSVAKKGAAAASA